MPSVISAALLRFLPWIAGALLALGLFVYILHEHAALRRAELNVAAARDTVAQLEATNRENLDALKRLQRTAAAWQVAQSEVAAKDGQRAAAARRMLDAIAASAQSAPQSAAAPVASAGGEAAVGIPAILARTLDSIAAAQAAGSGGAAGPPSRRPQDGASNSHHPQVGAKP